MLGKLKKLVSQAQYAAREAGRAEGSAHILAREAIQSRDLAEAHRDTAKASASSAGAHAEASERQADIAREAEAGAGDEAETGRIGLAVLIRIIRAFTAATENGEPTAMQALIRETEAGTRALRLLTGEAACAEADADQWAAAADNAEAEATELEALSETLAKAAANGDSEANRKSNDGKQAAKSARNKATELREQANAAYKAADHAEKTRDRSAETRAALAISEGGDFVPVPKVPEYEPPVMSPGTFAGNAPSLTELADDAEREATELEGDARDARAHSDEYGEGGGYGTIAAEDKAEDAESAAIAARAKATKLRAQANSAAGEAGK